MSIPNFHNMTLSNNQAIQIFPYKYASIFPYKLSFTVNPTQGEPLPFYNSNSNFLFKIKKCERSPVQLDIHWVLQVSINHLIVRFHQPLLLLLPKVSSIVLLESARLLIPARTTHHNYQFRGAEPSPPTKSHRDTNGGSDCVCLWSFSRLFQWRSSIQGTRVNSKVSEALANTLAIFSHSRGKIFKN